eukprot:TRINITY_DN4046_c1_g1_i1.p3 TRINITY_DN4046_c1_g1~~TRINITY_DN4046_c1_g1_i1.p3  ORF type:complete len:271 (-),score=72.61 TRINITY_DN4046_c1_g1_i1:1303-2115(-)
MPRGSRRRPLAMLGAVALAAYGHDKCSAAASRMWDPRTHWQRNSVAAADADTNAGKHSDAVAGGAKQAGDGDGDGHEHGRQLQTGCGVAPNPVPCCVFCLGLNQCRVLNSYAVEEKYYPGGSGTVGSCTNFDDRVSRLDVFGPEKTFRDTPDCRKWVYAYTCLWWGTDNAHFDNRCGSFANRPPCRSFCVQVAEVCANDPGWKALCADIACPPIADDCVPGPFVKHPVEPDACFLYEYNSPLQGDAATARGGGAAALAATALLLLLPLLG